MFCRYRRTKLRRSGKFLIALIACAAFGGLAPAASRDAAAPAAAASPCSIKGNFARFELRHSAARFSARRPIKIIAIGSSSTAGAGASSTAATYPSRLAADLAARFPDRAITVLNRGINGEEAADMVARFNDNVLAEQPDLVLWQVGTNTVLRDHDIGPTAQVIRDGVAMLKRRGIDVVLIDPQYAPSVIAKRDTPRMISLLAEIAKETDVDLFERFALMQHWHDVEGIDFATFIAPDKLHMNDWSYACVARFLSASISEALLRPTATASAFAYTP